MAEPYSAELRSLVIEYYKDDHSITECVSKFNISRRTIADYLKRANVTRSMKDRMILRESKKERGNRWNGGRSLGYKPGYMAIYIGRKNGNSSYKAEHVVITEKALGRPLKRGEVIHHINGNGLDNRNGNLLICDRKYHSQLHQTMAKRYQQEHFGG